MPFDRSKFIERFRAETRERIQKLNLGLLKLEKRPGDPELLEAMMREAHTIKGSATMMGYKRMADIAHKMEDGLEKAMQGKIVMKKIHFDILFKCLDALAPLLEDKVTWQAKGIERPFVDKLCREAEDVFAGRVKEIKTKAKKTKKSSLRGPKIRPEAISSKIAQPVASEAKQSISAPRNDSPVPAPTSSAAEESMRVDIEKLDKLVNLSGELLISKIRLNELVKTLTSKSETRRELTEEPFGSIMKDLNSVNENIDFLTSGMQEEVMKVRMVPVSFLFNAFPRAMRDLAQKKRKEVDFTVKGEDTQLDKAIIDEMKDPIMHLLRNAVDHGIETPGERESGKKPTPGSITLSAYQQGSQVVIEVTDDGKGVDLEKVKERAIEKKMVSRGKINEMADEQVYQLLFTPGFSTKNDVSETSGRGVGLNVVRESIAKLKGMVEVSSEAGRGTKFTIRLPLTLAITESLLVTAGSDTFAIPIEAVVETVRIKPGEIKTIETKEAISVRSRVMPLVRLSDIFGLPRRGIVEKRFFPVVIVQSVEKRIGLLIDELMGRQDIISKAIGDPLKKVQNIAGATILGSGNVVLILDIPSIIEAAECVIVKKPAFKAKTLEKGKRKKTILLAEDVLSTAMLEKNVLEAAGFSVVIARDGREALERAAQETFDLVITDILMPRMDGFELVERLRRDKLYKDVPIIVVTTRESDADKKRGLKAGADAYLLKSEFTGEGLLDTIERLLG